MACLRNARRSLRSSSTSAAKRPPNSLESDGRRCTSQLGLLGRVAEPIELRLARQAGQRALFELSRPLGREAELRTRLPKRPGLVAAEPEAQADDVALCL